MVGVWLNLPRLRKRRTDELAGALVEVMAAAFKGTR